MEKVKLYLWLALKEISLSKTGELFECFGSIENIYRADDYTEIERLRRKDAQSLMDKSMYRAEDVYEQCVRKGVRIITLEDENYPELLKNTTHPPCVLYVKGKNINLNNEFCVGVVGTRHSTSYGERAATMLCRGFARGDILIVSGLAMGIDSVAAWAALREGKPTVAVLGCGIDLVYPKSNIRLYEEIERNGMIISEYPPGTPAAPWTFPRRNRIIAGISRGVMVVEGSRRSGSMITANFALEYNRDIFAVPRNIDEPHLDGTNALIKDGAVPITSADDIFEHYPELKNRIRTVDGGFVSNNNYQLSIDNEEYPVQSYISVPKQQITEDKKEEIFALIKNADSEEEKNILEFISDSAVHIDNIAEALKINADELNMKLVMLEIKGVVEQLPGKLFRIKF